jgi:hypothetical protein
VPEVWVVADRSTMAFEGADLWSAAGMAGEGSLVLQLLAFDPASGSGLALAKLAPAGVDVGPFPDDFVYEADNPG